MEKSSLAFEIDGEAICLETGTGKDGGVERNQENHEDMGRSKENGKEGERREKLAIVLSRKELTKELLGQVVHSEEEAYKLYCDYGHRMGFSVRKGKQYYYTGTKNIRTKDYYCSKEGHKDDVQPNEVNFNRPEYRTNCKAMIRFKVDEQGQWKVIHLVSEHNHELAKPGERHLLRSARPLAVVKPGATDAMVNDEAQLVNEQPDMIKDDVGSDNVGFTKRDCYNNGSMQNIMVIEPGDCQNILSHFKRRSNEEGMFYWNVQVDQESRVTNFFWRDGRSRIDYDCFGDVVVFDTTCRANRYNMICAPVFGVNHHCQIIMFGCAFLLDESTTSYVWLFKSFLESMGDQPPKSILTDHHEAMATAIQDVFPNSRHRFSQWHIQKNAQSHLAALNAGETFQNLFTKCLHGCDSEMEFEETWVEMLSEFRLHDNSWFDDLYRLRSKWSTAFDGETFDGGINSSQRCESLNNLLNGITDESTSFTRFAVAFEEMIRGWRRKESEEDFRCSQTAPVRAIKHSSILKHAAEAYTHKIYKLFETEFLDGICATSYREAPSSGTLHRFELTMQGRGSKVWVVLLDTSTMEVSCSCKKFETMGLLCSHALKALTLKNVDKIPERYILKRWTKDAKRMVYEVKHEASPRLERTEAELMYCNHAMQCAYNLVIKSQGDEESRKIFWDTLESGEKALENFLAIKSLHMQPSVRDKETNKKKKRKKKSSQGETSSRKEKLAVIPSLSDSAYITPPRSHQAYPAASVPTSQIYIHPNMRPIAYRASQEYLAYGMMRPPSAFGGAKNI